MRTKTSPTQSFPYPQGAVFEAVQAVLPKVPSTLGAVDPASGTVTATTSPSWRSWGERLTVKLWEERPGITSVTITSQSTLQVVDWGKNTKNIDFFIPALTSFLEHNYGHVRTTEPPSTS